MDASLPVLCAVLLCAGVLNYCVMQVVIFKIGTGHIEIGIVIGKRFWLHGKFFFISVVHFNY